MQFQDGVLDCELSQSRLEFSRLHSTRIKSNETGFRSLRGRDKTETRSKVTDRPVVPPEVEIIARNRNDYNDNETVYGGVLNGERA